MLSTSVVTIIPYQDKYQSWFEKLNRNWIEKYFWMEPLDYKILQHPQETIIDKGGRIFMAGYEGVIVGTVALKLDQPGIYELTKMAVDEKYQGRKIGKALAEAAIAEARQLGAFKIFLFSSTKLNAALMLYHKLGFIEVPVDGPYKRSDIKMELTLS